jgi:general secretion pathway protein C
MKRWPLIASFVLFMALCASVAYWALQVFRPPLRAVAAPAAVARPAPKLEAAAALFGGRSTGAVASNYQLKGVVVSGDPADSIAILATDGKPARAVRANAEIAPGVTVKEVHRRYVLIAEGGATKRVELPEDAKGQAKVDMATRTPVPAQTVQTAPPAAAAGMPPKQSVVPAADPQAASPNTSIGAVATPAPAAPTTPGSPAQPQVSSQPQASSLPASPQTPASPQAPAVAPAR